MTTTVAIKSDLLARAAKISGILKKKDLVEAGLETFIRVQAGRELAAQGGTMPDLKPIRRRR